MQRWNGKILSLCTEAGFSPDIAGTASTSSSVLALVVAGEGIAIIPEGSRFMATAETTFVPLAGTSVSVDLVMAWSTDRLNAVMRSFLAPAANFTSNSSVDPSGRCRMALSGRGRLGRTLFGEPLYTILVAKGRIA